MPNDSLSELPSGSPPPTLAAPDGITAWEALHPRARVGMALGGIVGAVALYSPPAAIVLAAWDSGGWSVAARGGLFCAGLGLAVAFGWRYALARFARIAFALDDAGLRIRRGLWWRSETLVPRSRVQHTDLNRGPLDRRLGLATLKVYTAGTKLASVALDGLPEARAEQLRDALVTRDDDAV